MLIEANLHGLIHTPHSHYTIKYIFFQYFITNYNGIFYIIPIQELEIASISAWISIIGAEMRVPMQNSIHHTGPPLTLTEAELEQFIKERLAAGIKKSTADKYRSYLRHLCQWLPADKTVTQERLQQWRAELEAHGYRKATVEKFVTYANLYVRHCGHPELSIKKRIAYDLCGQQFGYLTPLRPTEKRNRRDVVWLCRCRCGKEVEAVAGLLLRGNTTSCGCLQTEILDYHNRYVAGTELRQSMMDQPISTRAASGYTGVTRAKGRWLAYITYKKTCYRLGYYTHLEDAVRARARAKEAVIADATRLYAITAPLYVTKPEKPVPKAMAKRESQPQASTPIRRRDNVSGCTGVKARRGRWVAELTYRGKRYYLGTYTAYDEAVRARQRAEELREREDEAGLAAMQQAAPQCQGPEA